VAQVGDTSELARRARPPHRKATPLARKRRATNRVRTWYAVAIRGGIRATLLAGFGATALFTGVLGWYAVMTMERLNHGERTMYVDVFGGTHLLGRCIDDSCQVRSDVVDMLISDDPFEREALRAGIAATDPKLVELTRQMGQADTDREDVNTLADIDTSWRAYTQWRDQALASVAAGDRAGALASYRTDGLRLARITDAAIDAFMKKKQVVGVRIAGTAEATYEETRRMAIVLSIAAAGFGLLIGFFLSRSIARTARQVAAAAKGLAAGDLDQRIDVRSGDETGQMAAAFREMIAYQQEMARVAAQAAPRRGPRGCTSTCPGRGPGPDVLDRRRNGARTTEVSRSAEVAPIAAAGKRTARAGPESHHVVSSEHTGCDWKSYGPR